MKEKLNYRFSRSTACFSLMCRVEKNGFQQRAPVTFRWINCYEIKLRGSSTHTKVLFSFHVHHVVLHKYITLGLAERESMKVHDALIPFYVVFSPARSFFSWFVTAMIVVEGKNKYNFVVGKVHLTQIKPKWKWLLIQAKYIH